MIAEEEDDVVNDPRVIGLCASHSNRQEGSLRFVDCGYLNFVSTLGATQPAA
jgi:hypothetical protein